MTFDSFDLEVFDRLAQRGESFDFAGLVLKWANAIRHNVYNHEIHEQINLSYFVSFSVFRGSNKTAEVKINSFLFLCLRVFAAEL